MEITAELRGEFTEDIYSIIITKKEYLKPSWCRYIVKPGIVGMDASMEIRRRSLSFEIITCHSVDLYMYNALYGIDACMVDEGDFLCMHSVGG